MLQSLRRDECLGFGNCLELGPWSLGILERGFLWSLVFGIWCFVNSPIAYRLYE